MEASPSSTPVGDEASSERSHPGPATLLDRISKVVPGGRRLLLCLQCGVCGGSCPTGESLAETPRLLFELLRSGLEEEALRSRTPWRCLACYTCVSRCPQEVPIPELMHALKRLSLRAGAVADGDAEDFSRLFIENVERYGRSYELGLARHYYLSHHRRDQKGAVRAGLELARRHRLAPRPEKISDRKGLRAILARARALEAAP